MNGGGPAAAGPFRGPPAVRLAFDPSTGVKAGKENTAQTESSHSGGALRLRKGYRKQERMQGQGPMMARYGPAFDTYSFSEMFRTPPAVCTRTLCSPATVSATSLGSTPPISPKRLIFRASGSWPSIRCVGELYTKLDTAPPPTVPEGFWLVDHSPHPPPLPAVQCSSRSMFSPSSTARLYTSSHKVIALPCRNWSARHLRNITARCARFTSGSAPFKCLGHSTCPRGLSASHRFRGGQSSMISRFSRCAHEWVAGSRAFGISDTVRNCGHRVIATSSIW